MWACIDNCMWWQKHWFTFSVLAEILIVLCFTSELLSGMNSNHHLMQTIHCSWLQMLCSTTSIFWLAVSSWQLLVLSHVHVFSRGWFSKLIFKPIYWMSNPIVGLCVNCVSKDGAVKVVLGFLPWIRVVMLWESPTRSHEIFKVSSPHSHSCFWPFPPVNSIPSNECICISLSLGTPGCWVPSSHSLRQLPPSGALALLPGMLAHLPWPVSCPAT